MGTLELVVFRRSKEGDGPHFNALSGQRIGRGEELLLWLVMHAVDLTYAVRVSQVSLTARGISSTGEVLMGRHTLMNENLLLSRAESFSGSLVRSFTRCGPGLMVLVIVHTVHRLAAVLGRTHYVVEYAHQWRLWSP